MKSKKTRSWLKPAAAALLALSAASTVRADYPSTVLSQSPVGYWRLNETTVPVPPSVGVNSGSLGATDALNLIGSPVTGQTGAIGGSDTGLGFDGVTSWVQAPYDAAINTPTFTVEAWLRPDNVAIVGGLTCAMSAMHSGSPRTGWLIYQNYGPNGGSIAGTGWVFRTYNAAGTATAINVGASNAIVAGTWYHIVATYDGSVAKVYVNGVLGASQTNASYVVNNDSPFSIGARSDNGFPWQGAADEVAYYGSVLTASQVLAHYNAGLAANPSAYATQVLASSPLGYWHLDQAPDPVAANLGTLGTAAKGAYIYSALPGQAGPQPPTYPVFEAGNDAVSFDGSGGSVTIPNLNLNTNTVTVTCWIKPNGGQVGNAGVFFNQGSATSAKFGLQINSGGGFGLSYNWNSIASATALAGPTLTDSDWNFAALIVSPNQAVVFIPGQVPVTNVTAHPVLAFDGKSTIGTGTSNFNGTIDEVSIFNRALSLGEAYSQYAAAVGNFGPQIFTDLSAPANPLFTGDTLSLVVDVGGTPNLSYQWRKNTSPIAGATGSAYTKTGITGADNGSYDVVVTNLYGTVTSAAAAITVNTATSPAISQGPVGRAFYPGGTLDLTVVASGGGLKYQWIKSSTAIPGATTSAYIVNSVTTADAGSYTVSVTNSLGAVTGGPAVISVPTLVSNTFAQVVDADAPEAWWRLDESTGAAIMADAMGRHDGYYSNSSGGVVLGSAGAISNGVFGTCASFDGSSGFASVPYSPSLNGAGFTVECWVYLTNAINGVTPVSSHDSPAAGFFIGTQSSEWHGFIGSGGTDFFFGQGVGQTAGYDPSIKPGQWTHVVITCQPSGQFPLQFWVNGTTDGFIWGDFTRNTAAAFLVGACGQGASSPTRFLPGRVDEVAFYTRPLTAAQILAHYNAGIFLPNTAPFFTSQPQSQTIVVGSNITFSATVNGTTPLTYQWLKGGTPIAGQTTNILSIPNAYFTDAGGYSLRASNTAGVSTSAVAVLTVEPYPSFVNATNGLVLHLKFDGNYQDSSGRGNNGTPSGSNSLPSIVPGVVGSGAVHYFTHTDTAMPATAATVTNNAYVSLGTPADLSFGSSQDFSVAYWVRLPVGYVNGDLPFLSSSGTSWGAFGLTFAPSYQRGGWSWSLINSGNTGPGLYGPDNSINDGNWHNLVHTFSRTGNGITYLDGVQVNATDITSAGDIDSGNDFEVGQGGGSPGFFSTYAEEGSADVDDMAVWRRVVTQAEAQNIYLVGKSFGRSFDTYGPVSLTIKSASGGLDLSWQAGTLQEATSVTGPWTPVAGATAPFLHVTPASSGAHYYRVKL